MLMVLPLVEMLTAPVALIDDVAGTDAITEPPLLLNVTHRRRRYELAKFKSETSKSRQIALKRLKLLWEVKNCIALCTLPWVMPTP